MERFLLEQPPKFSKLLTSFQSREDHLIFLRPYKLSENSLQLFRSIQKRHLNNAIHLSSDPFSQIMFKVNYLALVRITQRPLPSSVSGSHNVKSSRGCQLDNHFLSNQRNANSGCRLGYRLGSLVQEQCTLNPCGTSDVQEENVDSVFSFGMLGRFPCHTEE